MCQAQAEAAPPRCRPGPGIPPLPYVQLGPGRLTGGTFRVVCGERPKPGVALASCSTANKGPPSWLVACIWRFCECTLIRSSTVLHGESSKHLAPPRNTKDKEDLQSTQMTANRHNSQIKHQAPLQGQSKSPVQWSEDKVKADPFF